MTAQKTETVQKVPTEGYLLLKEELTDRYWTAILTNNKSEIDNVLKNPDFTLTKTDIERVCQDYSVADKPYKALRISFSTLRFYVEHEKVQSVLKIEHDETILGDLFTSACYKSDREMIEYLVEHKNIEQYPEHFHKGVRLIFTYGSKQNEDYLIESTNINYNHPVIVQEIIVNKIYPPHKEELYKFIEKQMLLANSPTSGDTPKRSHKI